MSPARKHRLKSQQLRFPWNNPATCQCLFLSTSRHTSSHLAAHCSRHLPPTSLKTLTISQICRQNYPIVFQISGLTIKFHLVELTPSKAKHSPWIWIDEIMMRIDSACMSLQVTNDQRDSSTLKNSVPSSPSFSYRIILHSKRGHSKALLLTPVLSLSLCHLVAIDFRTIFFCLTSP